MRWRPKPNGSCVSCDHSKFLGNHHVVFCNLLNIHSAAKYPCKQWHWSDPMQAPAFRELMYSSGLLERPCGGGPC